MIVQTKKEDSVLKKNNNDPGYFTFFPKGATDSFISLPAGGPNAEHFPTNPSVVADSTCQSRDDHFNQDHGSQTLNQATSDAGTPRADKKVRGEDVNTNQDKLVMVDDHDSDDDHPTTDQKSRSHQSSPRKKKDKKE